MPGPRSLHHDGAVAGRATETTASGGLHLRALSSRLPTARERRSPSAETQHSSETRSKVTPCVRPCVAATATASLTSRSSRSGSLADRQLVAAGQFGQVADQVGQLLELHQDVVDQDRAVGLGELVDPADDLEIGAQAGERGAQLVGGVDDELALGAPGELEGLEQPVEGAAQPPELVGPTGRETAGDVGGLGQVLHRGGEGS